MGLSDLARHAVALSAAVPEIQGESVSCRKGCGACCRQVVPLTPPEALMLIEDLDAEVITRKRNLLRRFRKIAKRLQSEGMDRLPLFHHARDYFRLGMPCPFLEDESCSIHTRRPLVCREHLVVSPAENCADFPSRFVRLLPIALSVRDALEELSAECAGTGRETIPLSRSLEWAKANKALALRTWDSGWLFDRLEALCRAQIPALRDAKRVPQAAVDTNSHPAQG